MWNNPWSKIIIWLEYAVVTVCRTISCIFRYVRYDQQCYREWLLIIRNTCKLLWSQPCKMMNFIILVIGLNKIPMLLHFYAENIIPTWIMNITSDFLRVKAKLTKKEMWGKQSAIWLLHVNTYTRCVSSGPPERCNNQRKNRTHGRWGYSSSCRIPGATWRYDRTS